MQDAKFYDHSVPFTIPAACATPGDSVAPANKKILVVEEGPDSLTDCCLFLEEASYEVTRCGGALAALFAIMRVEPDLVLAELRKPLMNGAALVAELKAHRDTRQIPVILFARQDNARTRAFALEAGCDGFVSEDLGPQGFLDHVAKVLRKAEKPLRVRPTAVLRRGMRRATGS
jgi:DNA-binding response OmpR family regulator